MLKQFEKELSAYRKNNTLPQGDVKNALADIYEELWPSNKNWGASKVNRTCPSCVSDMMKSLCAHWESMKVEFKGVPDVKVTLEYIPEGMERKEFSKTITLEDTKGKPEYFKKEIKESAAETIERLGENNKLKQEELTIYINKLKWPQFKTYCKEQGLSVKGKTKKQLLKELGL